MKLREAKKINRDVIQWYMSTRIMGEPATVPPYSKEEMLESFRIVKKLNDIQVVRSDGKSIIYTTCDPRVADWVVQARGE